MNKVVKLFKTWGNESSFYYADDSTKEWSIANCLKSCALELFDAFPEYQQEMRKEAKQFLWSLSIERPE